MATKNMTHSFVIYEWQRSVSIFEVRDLFENLVKAIGNPPDGVSLWSADWRGKHYTYRSFKNKNLILKNSWRRLNYHWERKSKNESGYDAEFDCDIQNRKQFSVFYDENKVRDVNISLEFILAETVYILKPIYGFAFSVPYSWSPVQFVWGMGSGYTGLEEGLDYDSAEAFSIRGREFGNVLRSPQRGLDKKIRDVFEVNLISAGHLSAAVEGQTLKTWIESDNSRGILRQVGELTWRWDVPPVSIPLVRYVLRSAGLIVVPDGKLKDRGLH